MAGCGREASCSQALRDRYKQLLTQGSHAAWKRRGPFPDTVEARCEHHLLAPDLTGQKEREMQDAR
jgi:hypothetical protein